MDSLISIDHMNFGFYWLNKYYQIAHQPNPPKNENVNVVSLCTSSALHVNLMHSEAGEIDIHKHNRTCSNTVPL